MTVRLLYFAALRERLGVGEETLPLPPGVDTVGALREALRARGDEWRAALAEGRAVRAAVNQAMATPATRIADGDEIAFFPPVTGG